MTELLYIKSKKKNLFVHKINVTIRFRRFVRECQDLFIHFHILISADCLGLYQIITDFPKAVKRLLKNDILMFRTASSVLHILPIAGLYTFLPKYLESQFRLAAHAANMISGKVCQRCISCRPYNIQTLCTCGISHYIIEAGKYVTDWECININ